MQVTGAYIDALKELLFQHYTAIKNGKAEPSLKQQIIGFINAAELLNALSSTEALEIMEQVHFDIFHMGIIERKKAKEALQDAHKNSNEQFFETPSIERKIGKNKVNELILSFLNDSIKQ